MVNKRGQITVYIIIGIIAIMGLGVFMYMRGQRLPSQMLVSPTIEEIPTEAKPVSDFITDCLDATARSALERVGVQGGYTTNENMGGISNRVFPTEGDVVELFPKSKINVPYWYYISSDSETCFQTGQCRVDSKRPNLYRQQGDPSIEGQLDKFIEENVRVCLAGFSDFAEMGFEIREKGSPNVQTTITEKTVAFYMEYPFQITRGDTSFEIKQFFVDEPVRLKRMYDLATNITNLQGTANFLENYLLNLIPVYSSLNSNALPPFKASSFEFGPGEMWIDQTVKKRVEGILRKDIQLLHVFGTQNFENIPVSRNVGNTELNSVFKNRLTVIPVLDAFPGMEASFVYLDWPIYFDLICEAGGESMCRPSSLLSFIIMPFAMQEYKTSYFISFPILVELKDTEAYNGEGYFFNFFLEGNIANNNPVEIGKALSIQQTLGVPSQFCLRRMWDSPNITVTVWDKKEFGPLEGVNVNYGCGADSCLIGTTGEDGKLNAQFPRCIGGTLSLKKEHYLGAVGALSTELTGPRDDIKVYLEPKRKVDIVVKKIILLKDPIGGWQPQANNIVYFNKNEEAIVMMERISQGEEEFMAFAEYCNPVSGNDCLFEDIDIYPGKYNVEIIVISKPDPAFSIQPQERCEDDECFNVPETPIEFSTESPFFAGGGNYEISIEPNEIDNADIIELKALVVGLDMIPENDRAIEDMNVAMNLDAYQNMVGNALKPEYKKK